MGGKISGKVELSMSIHDVIELIEVICGRRKKPHRADHLRLTLNAGNFKISGEDMQFSMLANQKVSVIGNPVDASDNPSQAVLSNVQYSTSDPSVFEVDADPSTPNGAIVRGVGAGTATLTETATATEPDGTTQEQIQGVATIVLTTAPPPPPPVAASIDFTFGTPV